MILAHRGLDDSGGRPRLGRPDHVDAHRGRRRLVRSPPRRPEYGPASLRFRAHDDASNRDVLDVLVAAAATLAQVASAAPASARGYHMGGHGGSERLLAMACDEVLVHSWDARGFGVEFVPPETLAGRVVRGFPWAPKGGSHWQTLPWAKGRVMLPTQQSELAWRCDRSARYGPHETPDGQRYGAAS